MTRVQQNQFERTLEAKRDELKRQIAKFRERLTVDPSNDPLDRVRSISEREFAIRGIDQMSGALRSVEGALREIRDKTFGVCARCGDDIPLKRLRAIPWSPYCVSCQEHLEQSRRGEEPAEFDAYYALAS